MCSDQWLILRTVCTVNVNQTRRTMNAVDGFLKFITKVFPNSDVVFAGYAISEIWSELLEKSRLTLKRLPILVKFSIEDGKSTVINKTLAQYIDPTKHCWVFCSDSDIDYPLIADNLTLLENWTALAYQFDYIALNQSGDCRHNPSLLTQTPIQVAGQNIVARNQYVGIAGGAFSLSLECWRRIGGIPPIKGRYGAEDVLLLKSLQNHSCQTCIWIDFIVRHPENLEIDPEEIEFKLSSSLTSLNRMNS